MRLHTFHHGLLRRGVGRERRLTAGMSVHVHRNLRNVAAHVPSQQDIE